MSPPLGADAVSGKRFGELTRDDIVTLSRLASSLGRSPDTVKVLWEDVQRKLRAAKRKKPR
jgi:hypothetical protein